MARKSDKRYISNELPGLGSIQKKDVAQNFFHLGRASAKMDEQQRLLDQKMQLNLVQQIQLQESLMALKDMEANLERKNRMQEVTNAQGQGLPMGGPPPPPGMAGLPMEGPPPPMGGMPLPMEGGPAPMGGMPAL